MFSVLEVGRYSHLYNGPVQQVALQKYLTLCQSLHTFRITENKDFIHSELQPFLLSCHTTGTINDHRFFVTGK